MEKNSKIYVAGHTGMVGSAIVRHLEQNGYENIVTRTHAELDLTVQKNVEEFFRAEKPEYVFIAAAKVGGILSNKTYPASYIMENLLIACNIIEASYRSKVKKLLYMGSSCIYPKLCPQPIKEEYLMSGPLESSNAAYALAKITGIRICHHFNEQYGTNYITVMPASIYGLNDRYDAENSHVIPAMMIKMQAAKDENKPFVEVWGTGTPKREFLYVDDLADACVFLMNSYDKRDLINIGTGIEITIRDLAERIREVVGFAGELRFDATKPDGTLRKVLDVTKLSELGWQPKIDFADGLKRVYADYLQNVYKK